ncbi:unnamed protein product [Spirodela intermedia]|uniref:Uncharacterized protein n=2 Tax=Spirodela intermedia TaxID=51605 RepID=A0A7I8K1S2_SPIIN|nr:unnamed protein product [Spirodela intermedia]
MGTANFIAHSPPPPCFRSSAAAPKTRPICPPSFIADRGVFSLRPNNRHLPFAGGYGSQRLHRAPICSLSQPQWPSLVAKAFSVPFSSSAFPSLPSIDLSVVTPLSVFKWASVICVGVAVGRKVVEAVLNPFFWMYFSWTWLFWPWVVAVSLGVYGLCCLRKHAAGNASFFEQLCVVTSSIMWLTLVAPGHFNGYLEGWPVAFFFVYHYFFFFESTVRRRLYGDLFPRRHDPKWDLTLPPALRLAFSSLVMAGHWLAAWEGPELHLVPGGWANVGIWLLIISAIFTRYHSILYLAKYSEKVSVPTAVAQFGPYRWVRHPIYASTMLLFCAYCVALRAPLSCLFLIGICSAYYGQKAELEEKLMAETFGQKYTEYASRVRYKLIPLLY